MSGYVHSGINPMIKVEPYKHENKVLVANKYGNAKVGNFKENDIANAIQSIGNLNNLNTTDKSSIVAAVNEVATLEQSGRGEEQFQKVYETTLTEDTTHFAITNTDMDGVFVDVVVYVVLNYANAGDLFVCSFLTGSTALQTVPYIKMTASSPNLVFSCESRGGLLYGGYTMYDDGRENIDEQYHSAQGYSPEFYNGGEYPTEEKPGVSLIGFGFYDQTTLIPAGTTITVYARRKVTETTIEGSDL